MAETNDRPKLVVLNGSFNPPTLAHLDLLKKAMAAVGAGRGLFLPANDEYVRRVRAVLRDIRQVGLLKLADSLADPPPRRPRPKMWYNMRHRTKPDSESW